MKKYFLLFAAGGLLTLASCGGDTTPAETVNVDSIAAVKADSIANAMKAESDATIAASAQASADSMARIMRDDSIVAATKASANKGNAKTTTTKKPTSNTTKPTVNPVVVPEPSKQDNKFDKRNGTNTDIPAEKAKEQDDKFNRRGK